jgi:peptide/nickel transport system ATP-binding protein
MPLLNVQDLVVRFRLPHASFDAVDHVSFAIEAGQTLALVGESGCGKTLTALALLRLLPAQAQSTATAIQLGGRDLTTLTAREMRGVRGKGIGMVFQEALTALNPVYTIGEQVSESLRLHEGMTRRAAAARVEELFREVGLPDPGRLARSFPHQLSGGQRQRAMIALALACRPALLIADEPTTALDVSLQAQIIDLLLRLQEERNIAILLITHDLGIVAEMAHQVAVMYAGQIVEQAPCRTLFAQPLHPYTRALLASLPQLAATGAADANAGPSARRLAAIAGTVPDPSRLPSGCRFAPRCAQALEACGKLQELQEIQAGQGVRCARAKEWLA